MPNWKKRCAAAPTANSDSASDGYEQPKRPRTTVAAKSSADDSDEQAESEDQRSESDTRPERQDGILRPAAGKSKTQLAKQQIPRTYEECSPADKALVDMRDAGNSWKEVTARYCELSGLPAGSKSTLPNRYARIIAKFHRINAEDLSIIITAKLRVSAEQEAERFSRIANMVEHLGGSRYPPGVLESIIKQLYCKGDRAVLLAHAALEQDSGGCAVTGQTK